MNYVPRAPIRRSVLLWLLIAAPASAVTMAWTPIGNPGNACQVNATGYGGTSCYGGVDYAYSIATYVVTNAQYAEFLNATTGSDPNDQLHLWSPGMDPAHGGGIAQNYTFPYPGTYTYSVVAGRENLPVTWVSFYDALRFANWMSNGQGSGDTETGAYTIASGATRNDGATIVLANEGEWYKAAYYDPSSSSYFRYAAGSDSPSTCSTPTASPNTANCGNAVGGLTDVGAYTGSASPYGTFDQGGNVLQWTETIYERPYCSGPTCQVIRGGSYDLAAPSSGARSYFNPGDEDYRTGFRLVMLPEPDSGLLLVAGVLGLAGWRRGRA
jgi:formylglycine-generating enzyme required for sulfatase activity